MKPCAACAGALSLPMKAHPGALQVLSGGDSLSSAGFEERHHQDL